MTNPISTRRASAALDLSFTRKVDLASRLLGASVVAANDDLYAERENLIKPSPPLHQPKTFGHKGQIYDGWETRRRREAGYDWAIIRLGVAGIVRGVVVDTAWFTGNYPPEISVEGIAVEGYPSPEELVDGSWITLVPRSPVKGDSLNPFEVTSDRRITHVRLSLYPDGGVSRLRVHGDVVADPRFMSLGSVDLAALANGGSVVDCSNMFYSSPTNLIAPGDAHVMSEGWETSRRRDDGNDWVELALAGPGTVELAELDTRHFVGNAPGWARLSGIDARVHELADRSAWRELMPRERLQPDTPHRFILSSNEEVTHVRLDIYPDGGMARLRLWGDLSAEGREALSRLWYESLPADHVRQINAVPGPDETGPHENGPEEPPA